MRGLLFILFVSGCLHGFCQKIIRGRVTDAEKNLPLARASVFLNNTSIGTSTDENGRFALQVPAGKFELIISSIGYESHYQVINPSDNEMEYLVKLNLKEESMEEVIILPYDPDGWRNWGNFFIDHFIGTRSESSDCKIKNSGALKFRLNKITDELIVTSSEPLVIENKALGYKVIYDLVKFSFSFKTRYLVFSGYPFFEEMEGNLSKKQKWKKKRLEVYQGSLMHFMRSVYMNTIIKEGFEIRRLRKEENLEKARVKQVLKSHYSQQRQGTQKTIQHNAPDSSKYYQRIMEENDFNDIVGSAVLPGDSIAYAVDSVTAGVDFENYLLVMYMKKKPPQKYLELFPKAGNQMISEITLVNRRPVEIKSNGMFYDSIDLLSQGYWSWAEKICVMLPFDFDDN
jgi:hypothetical protein